MLGCEPEPRGESEPEASCLLPLYLLVLMQVFACRPLKTHDELHLYESAWLTLSSAVSLL